MRDTPNTGSEKRPLKGFVITEKSGKTRSTEMDLVDRRNRGAIQLNETP